MSKAFFCAALLAMADARLSQEQAIFPIVSSLTKFGKPGAAETLAGSTPGVLLATTDPCEKLRLADQIVTELGTDAAVIDGAKKLVAAEQNFNPSAVSTPSICGDPSLPATKDLRGIVPLVDPAVVDSDVENANSRKSLTEPFSADSISVAQVMIANGFSNFTQKFAVAAGSAGNTGLIKTGLRASSENPWNSTTGINKGSGSNGSKNPSCNASHKTSSKDTASKDNNSTTTNSAGSGPATQVSTIPGLDFGLCVPTIKFEGGVNGRKITEFTFAPVDPLVGKGQQEALNPNIITNRICDQLTNVCQANQAAKDACTAAKTKIAGLGTRNKSTADAWNEALGFAGADTNPDKIGGQ